MNRMSRRNALRSLPMLAGTALIPLSACSSSPIGPSKDQESVAALPGSQGAVAPTIWRGPEIVRVAEKYVSEKAAKEECKDFVRRIVKEASGGRVIVPSTAGGNTSWVLPAKGVELFASHLPTSPRPIYGVDQGDAIQMVSRNTGLHTAFVRRNFGTGMTFVEANYPAFTVRNTRSIFF